MHGLPTSSFESPDSLTTGFPVQQTHPVLKCLVDTRQVLNCLEGDFSNVSKQTKSEPRVVSGTAEMALTQHNPETNSTAERVHCSAGRVECSIALPSRGQKNSSIHRVCPTDRKNKIWKIGKSFARNLVAV